MSKAWPALLLTSALVFGAAAPAAAGAETPPADDGIQVFVAQEDSWEPVTFATPPVIENGSTLVPFRAIFEKLGMSVEWNPDTQTVIGKAAGKEIKLQIGSSKAYVNGEEKTLSVAPVIKNNATLVPLRFVGEGSGLEVSWNGYDRTILIAPVEDQLVWVYNKNLEYSNDKNLDGTLSTIVPNSIVYHNTREQLQQVFANQNLKFELLDAQVKEIKDDTAVLETKTLVEQTAGDKTTKVTQTALNTFKLVNKQWYISQTVEEKSDFMLEDQYKDEKPQVSTDVQNAVYGAMEQYRLANEKEDFAAYESLLDPQFPNRQQDIDSFKQAAAQIDFKIKYTDQQIIKATDTTVVVRYKVTITYTKTPYPVPNVLVDTADTWHKNDKGEWKLLKEDTLSMTKLLTNP